MKKHIKYITALALTAAVALASPLADIRSAEAKTLTELQNEREQLAAETREAQKKLDEAR